MRASWTGVTGIVVELSRWPGIKRRVFQQPARAPDTGLSRSSGDLAASSILMGNQRAMKSRTLILQVRSRPVGATTELDRRATRAREPDAVALYAFIKLTASLVIPIRRR